MGLEPEQRIFQEEKKMAEEYIRGVFRKLGKTNQNNFETLSYPSRKSKYQPNSPQQKP